MRQNLNAEEMEKINPWLRGGCKGYFTDNKLKEKNNA